MFRIIMMFVMIVISAAPVLSAGQPEVKVQLTAQRVVKNSQGRETFTAGETAKPGDTIEYRAVYKNSGTATAHNVLATLPVPPEMEYLPDTASPATASASTNGIAYSGMPLKRKVKLASGAIAIRDVPVDEYRSLRWDLRDLPPGSSAIVSARMKIRASQKGPVIIKYDSIHKHTPKGDEK